MGATRREFNLRKLRLAATNLRFEVFIGILYRAQWMNKIEELDISLAEAPLEQCFAGLGGEDKFRQSTKQSFGSLQVLNLRTTAMHGTTGMNGTTLKHLQAMESMPQLTELRIGGDRPEMLSYEQFKEFLDEAPEWMYHLNTFEFQNSFGVTARSDIAKRSRKQFGIRFVNV